MKILWRIIAVILVIIWIFFILCGGVIMLNINMNISSFPGLLVFMLIGVGIIFVGYSISAQLSVQGKNTNVKEPETTKDQNNQI